MTAKEKAKDIYLKFYHSWDAQYTEAAQIYGTKKMCYICIDEIISACEYNFVETYNTDWWNRVRKQIEQM